MAQQQTSSNVSSTQSEWLVVDSANVPTAQSPTSDYLLNLQQSQQLPRPPPLQQPPLPLQQPPLPLQRPPLSLQQPPQQQQQQQLPGYDSGRMRRHSAYAPSINSVAMPVAARQQQNVNVQQNVPMPPGFGYAPPPGGPFSPPQDLFMQQPFGPVFGNYSSPHAPHTSFADDDDIGASGSAVADTQPEPPPPAVCQGSVEVSTRIEYSALARGRAQDVFGLVTVRATSEVARPQAPQEQERQPMDITCVLDVSGSMMGDKIRNVQSAVRFIVSQAGTRDRLSIVAFNSNADRKLHLCRMDVQGKDSAIRATLQLQAGGGTNIARGLSMGVSVMEQRRQKNSVSTILLLTDGQDRSAQQHIPALIERARNTGSSVYTFGFGKDHDAALLSSIAEQAQTPFSFIEDDDAIRSAFAGAVGGLSSIVAQEVQLTLNHHVPLKNIHTPFTVRRSSDSEAIVTIPDLFAGESRDILVELSAPASAPQGDGSTSAPATRLLDAFAVYKDLRKNGARMQTPIETMEAERVADSEQPEVEPDEEVQAHRERVQVTQVLQSASAAADAGNFQGAQEQLREVTTSMRSRKATRFTMALDSEVQDASVRMNGRMAWEQGGRAEVYDAVSMHSVQRCTNTLQSATSAIEKTSKSMYMMPTQCSWERKARSSTAP